MTVYDFQARSIDGKEISLSEYRGKPLLIVNVASKCGFTPQYKGLQALHDRYKAQGFTVLGFPCDQFGHQEPGNEGEIQSFCELNFGVNFPLFSKIEVNGPGAIPLYRYLTSQKRGFLGSKSIKWNFTKFLIDRDGRPVKRYAPTTKPAQLEGDIEKLLRK